jgi:hypothetical protein
MVTQAGSTSAGATREACQSALESASVAMSWATAPLLPTASDDGPLGRMRPSGPGSRSGRATARYFWPGLLTMAVARFATPAPLYPSPLIV